MSRVPEISKNLNWIEDDSDREKPVFEETPIQNRTIGKLLMNKFSENIFVPMGLVATTACLTLGLINMSRGNQMKQQQYMRGRVFFQILTFVAMTSGVFIASLQNSDKKRKRQDAEDIKGS